MLDSRKNLKLREVARDKLCFLGGDDSSISLWHDNWHPIDPPVDKFGDWIIYNSVLGRNALVKDIIEGIKWKWPIAQSIEWLELKEATPHDFKPITVQEDRLQWTESSDGQFSFKNAWESLRSRGQRVDWFRVFWHSKAIPRHVMIVWLAIQGKLNTQE